MAMDLGTMSLEDMASAINAAATAAGSAVSASVVSEIHGRGGETTYRLDISGTTSFSDANGILETLGILEAGRSEVAQEVSSTTAFTDGDASTVATGATILQNLWLNGAGAGVQVGRHADPHWNPWRRNHFHKEPTRWPPADTLQDMVDALNSATDGFQAGDRTATASVSAEGRLVVTDDQGGGSWLALDIVAHNEGGGTLDFGSFATTRRAGPGRSPPARTPSWRWTERT